MQTLSAGPIWHLSSNGWFFSGFLIVWRVTVSHILQPCSWHTRRSPGWPLLQVLELCAMCQSRTTKVIHTCNGTQFFALTRSVWLLEPGAKKKVTVMQIAVWPRSAPLVAFCALAPTCFPNVAHLHHFPVFQHGNAANVKCFPWHKDFFKMYRICVSLSGLETKYTQIQV